jgi:hypothetical protein
MKRKKLGIKTPSKGRSGVLGQWEHETEQKRESEGYGNKQGCEARTKPKTDYYDDNPKAYGRLGRETFDLAQDTMNLDINNHSKPYRGNVKTVDTMDKLQEITMARSTLVREHSQDIEDQFRDGIINGSNNQRHLDEQTQSYAGGWGQRRLDTKENINFNFTASGSGPRDSDTMMNFTSGLGERNLNTMKTSLDFSSRQCKSDTMKTITTPMNEAEIDCEDNEDFPMTDEKPAVQGLATKESDNKDFENYSPFIMDMIKKHPKMLEKVNEAPQRKTALDMWPYL